MRAGVIGVLVAAGCSSQSASPDHEIQLSALIVSDARGTSYVSLPPGSLDAVSAQIHNTTNGESSPRISLVDGGFDPVEIPATAGDELEVSFSFADRTEGYVREFVPVTRSPRVVRMSPGTGTSGVSVTPTATIVMSEPIAAGTFPSGVHLTPGAFDVFTRIAAPSQPWLIEVTPDHPLVGATTYSLSVWSSLTDLTGDPAQPATETFTTSAVPMPVPLTTPLAFVSDRDGVDRIYIAQGDGSITALTEGVSPAWSPDGQQIAFVRVPSPDWRGYTQVGTMYLIDRDGSNLRELGAGGRPAWSPDGTQIAFVTDTGGADVMNADGTNTTLLLAGACYFDGVDSGCEYARSVAWSPDVTTVAVYTDFEIYLVRVDGSQPTTRLLVRGDGASYSPDGSRILFSNGGIFSVLVDGSDMRQEVPVEGIGGVGRSDWSPDTRAIVFSGIQGSLFRMRILVSSGSAIVQEIPDVANPTRADYVDYDAAWSRVP